MTRLSSEWHQPKLGEQRGTGKAELSTTSQRQNKGGSQTRKTRNMGETGRTTEGNGVIKRNFLYLLIPCS